MGLPESETQRVGSLFIALGSAVPKAYEAIDGTQKEKWIRTLVAWNAIILQEGLVSVRKAGQ